MKLIVSRKEEDLQIPNNRLEHQHQQALIQIQKADNKTQK